MTHWLAAMTLAAALDVPITQVTVFSDRARVTRSAQVPVSGTLEATLPILSGAVDPDTIRVEAKGATVGRVDVSYVTEDQLPVDAVKKALQALDATDDTLNAVRAELGAVSTQLVVLGRLSPTLPVEPMKPTPRLSSKGWAAGLDVLDGRAARLSTRLQALEDQRVSLEQTRKAQLDALTLLGAAAPRSGWKVSLTLEGNGTATVTETYMAGNARWYPRYDVQLDGAKSQVQLAFSGLVSQETGEDWTQAALTLSTAVPATATRFPTVRAWKLGEKERFIPTPSPVREQVAPVPRAPALPQRSSDVAALRARLATLGVGQGRGGPPAGAASTANYDFEDDAVDQDFAKEEESVSDKRMMPRPEKPKPAPERKAMRELSRDAAPSAPAAAPPPPPAEAQLSRRKQVAVASSEELSPAREAFGLVAPTYVPPIFAPELPAAAAGGYDLAWPSARKETLPSGQGARRVALFTRNWPVSVERSLYPAVFPEAYLVAELKNPSSEPLPAGQAALFVGADPSGSAKVPLVSPGETFTLPLGIDRALTPVRRVTVQQSEAGVISKTETTEYLVTIEVANPYPSAVPVRLYDQLPLSRQKEVQVELVSATPTPIQDKKTGKLEWRLTLPAGQKTTVKVSYRLTRPKGWQLSQEEVAP